MSAFQLVEFFDYFFSNGGVAEGCLSRLRSRKCILSNDNDRHI